MINTRFFSMLYVFLGDYFYSSSQWKRLPVLLYLFHGLFCAKNVEFGGVDMNLSKLIFPLLLIAAMGCPQEVPPPEDKPKPDPEQEEVTLDAGVPTNNPPANVDAGTSPTPTDVDAGMPEAIETNDAGTMPPTESNDAGTMTPTEPTDAGVFFPFMIHNYWESPTYGAGSDGGLSPDNSFGSLAVAPEDDSDCNDGYEHCASNSGNVATCCKTGEEYCFMDENNVRCAPMGQDQCDGTAHPQYCGSSLGSSICCGANDTCAQKDGKAYCIKSCPPRTTACTTEVDGDEQVTDCCSQDVAYECKGASEGNGFNRCFYDGTNACPTGHTPCGYFQSEQICCPPETQCVEEPGIALCADGPSIKCTNDDDCPNYAQCLDHNRSAETVGTCESGTCEWADTPEVQTCANGCATYSDGRCYPGPHNECTDDNDCVPYTTCEESIAGHYRHKLWRGECKNLESGDRCEYNVLEEDLDCGTDATCENCESPNGQCILDDPQACSYMNEESCEHNLTGGGRPYLKVTKTGSCANNNEGVPVCSETEEERACSDASCTDCGEPGDTGCTSDGDECDYMNRTECTAEVTGIPNYFWKKTYTGQCVMLSGNGFCQETQVEALRCNDATCENCWEEYVEPCDPQNDATCNHLNTENCVNNGDGTSTKTITTATCEELIAIGPTCETNQTTENFSGEDCMNAVADAGVSENPCGDGCVTTFECDEVPQMGFQANFTFRSCEQQTDGSFMCEEIGPIGSPNYCTSCDASCEAPDNPFD